MRLLVDPSALRGTFQTADPFPHVVIDGLFPDADLEAIVSEFPPAEAEGWRRFDNAHEKKLGFFHETSGVPDGTRAFLDALNRFEMLLFLEALTGIDALIPDPYFGGGGLHQIEAGGFLQIHADFNVHPKLRLDRRLNVLVYLNQDWRAAYGGQLELWDAGQRECRRQILPTFNRTVIFATTDRSFHGHPQPLASPPGVTRKSVSAYYYTAGRPAGERSAPHDTLFLADADFKDSVIS